jgi:hypothetical protein
MQHFTSGGQGGVIEMRKKHVRMGFTAAQSAELWDRALSLIVFMGMSRKTIKLRGWCRGLGQVSFLCWNS